MRPREQFRHRESARLLRHQGHNREISLPAGEARGKRAADLLRHHIANVVDVIKRTIPLETVES